MKSVLAFGLAIVLASVSAAALADTEFKFDDGSHVLVKNNRVLFGDGNTGMLYPGSGDSLTVIEYSNRRYMVLDKEFAASMSDQISAARAQMEAQLAQLPPDQRAMMKNMLKDRMPQSAHTSKRQFRHTGGKQRVAGFSCKDGELLKDGKTEFEVCIASAKEIGMSAADYGALRSAFLAMSGIVEQFSPGNSNMFDLDLIGGVPVISSNRNGEQDNRLVSASFDDVDAARLEVPADFEQQDPAQALPQGN